MKEIRLTFRTDDFAAVSQALIGLGIGFRVEPVEEAPAESVGPSTAPAQPILKRRAAKRSAKAPGPAKKPPRGESLLTGADRLRSAIARKPADLAPATPPADAADAPRPPSGDNGM